MVRRMCLAGLLALGTACDLVAAPPPPPPCGAPGDAPCPFGTQCEDDPDEDCDPLRAACPGRCEAVPCGESLGLGCAEGQACIDDPHDDCQPFVGGPACPQVCAELPRPILCAEPGRTFVSHSQDLCEQILFICEVGWVPFYNSCGCGCQFLG